MIRGSPPAPVWGRFGIGATVFALVTLVGTGGWASGTQASSNSGSSGAINAVGAENEYANVLGQIGGRYVHVSSILDNPNTDPHTFESSPIVAEEVSSAQLVVQNGVGYDTFM